jgi:tetratricopeptide (TPR) repeat protein
MENNRLFQAKSLAEARNALFPAIVAIAFLALVPTGAVAQQGPTWEQFQKAGSDAFYAARYGDAERLLQQAVAKGALFGESDLRFAKSLGELGRLYTVRGRFGEAQALLEAELHVKEVALGKENTAIIPDMGSMIQFYLAYGSASDADPLTEQVLALLQGKLNEYSTQAHGKVTLKPGQPLTAWAGTADASMRDPLIEWAIAVDAIGDAYRAHRSYDTADRLYKAALDVKTTVLGKEHLSLANSYDSLGSLCLERNDYPEAESYLKDSLDMTERIQPPENPQVFSRLDKLAKCYISEKKYDDAERLYLRAQDFWKDNPSKRGAEARAKIALGSLYYDEKKFDLAAPILQQALQYAEEYHGADSIALVPYLQKYADALYYLGDKEETNQLKARANTIAGVGSTQ